MKKQLKHLVTKYQRLCDQEVDTRIQIKSLVDIWLKTQIARLRKSCALIPAKLSWRVDIEPTESDTTD